MATMHCVPVEAMDAGRIVARAWYPLAGLLDPTYRII